MARGNRSPNSQRRASRAGRGLGRMDLQQRRDLIVSGGYVNNSGVQVGTSGWEGNPVALNAGVQVAFQAICIPQAVTALNAAPGVGECRVVAVEGSLFVTSPSVAGLYILGFGIYISKFDTRTGTWGIRFPSKDSDAARDDWLFLRGVVTTLPVPASVTDPMMIECALSLPHPVILGGGESLHVAIDNNGASAGNLSVIPYFRTRIADVA